MTKRPSTGRTVAPIAAVKAAVTASRLIAFEILMLIRRARGHSDELLHSGRLEHLSQEDRNFTMALVMGVLRWQIALDAMVRSLLDRPEQRLAEEIAVVLELGAFQLLHMDRIPAHAALSESVELCRVVGQAHAAGMVNAVLRKVAAARRPGPSSVQPIWESVAAYSERLGHPQWMVERWVKEYGREATWKICAADQQEPGRGGLFLEADVEMPVMDDGSRLVAEMAAAAAPGARRVWDCCAAPGGKALVLAQRLGEAEVLATDISAKRVAMMEERVQRYGYATKVKCGVADAADRKTSGDEFDLILCDVPCSGTGTLAENPEIRQHLKVEDLARQAARQRAILEGASLRLAPSGRLVYSTCSLEPEECERVVDPILARGGWRRIPVDGLLEKVREQGFLREDIDLRSSVREGDLRTLPGVHPCAGFFAAVLERD